MSSDNFHFVEGDEVYMGFASDWDEIATRAEAKARRKYIKRIVQRGNPIHRATDQTAAISWAMREYSEYGLWWIDGGEE